MSATTPINDGVMKIFHEVFKDVQPISSDGRVTTQARMEVYRKAILRERRRGLTWDQIAAGMRDPRINEKVSGKMLSKLFGEKRRRIIRPPVPHLIIDPATGLPLPPT